MDTKTRTMAFPEQDWSIERPEDHGLDARRVADAAREIMTIDKRHGVLVAATGAVSN